MMSLSVNEVDQLRLCVKSGLENPDSKYVGVMCACACACGFACACAAYV